MAKVAAVRGCANSPLTLAGRGIPENVDSECDSVPTRTSATGYCGAKAPSKNRRHGKTNSLLPKSPAFPRQAPTPRMHWKAPWIVAFFSARQPPAYCKWLATPREKPSFGFESGPIVDGRGGRQRNRSAVNQPRIAVRRMIADQDRPISVLRSRRWLVAAYCPKLAPCNDVVWGQFQNGLPLRGGLVDAAALFQHFRQNYTFV